MHSAVGNRGLLLFLTYGRGATPEGNESHKHGHELDLNPQSGGLLLSVLTTVPVEVVIERNALLFCDGIN